MDGQATEPMVPHISGQQKEYLIAELKAYRSGKRQHEQMSIVARMLTDEDIDNVSEWYSSIKVSIEMPE
jgi:cytochrome c553